MYRVFLFFFRCTLQMLNFKSGVVTTGNSLDHTEMVFFVLFSASLLVHMVRFT